MRNMDHKLLTMGPSELDQIEVLSTFFLLKSGKVLHLIINCGSPKITDYTEPSLDHFPEVVSSNSYYFQSLHNARDQASLTNLRHNWSSGVKMRKLLEIIKKIEKTKIQVQKKVDLFPLLLRMFDRSDIEYEGPPLNTFSELGHSLNQSREDKK